MEINKIKRAAEIAKARTTDKRWVAAINKAVAGVESGWWIITELAHGVAVTTECGNTYFANGSCQCRAFTLGQACKHRALARLIEIANEMEAAEEAARRCDRIIADIKTIAADIETPSRADIIADIKSRWNHSEYSLADELTKRFKRNSLEMLSIDFLRAIAATL